MTPSTTCRACERSEFPCAFHGTLKPTPKERLAVLRRELRGGLGNTRGLLRRRLREVLRDLEAITMSVDYRELGARGGKANATAHDHEHFVRIGRAGGQATATRLTHEQQQENGRKGGLRVRALIEAGRAAEARERGR